jgi:hypothetical protein
LKPRSLNPTLLIKKEKELLLSGSSLEQLMRAVLDKNVPFRFRANGCSMAPIIKDGDLLTVCPFRGKPPGLGDVLAFSHPASGKLTVHRIIAQKKPLYRIKGDGADAADGLVSQSNLIGIIRKVERNGHKVLIGLGPERFLIALLSAKDLFPRVLHPFQRLVQIFRGVRYDA